MAASIQILTRGELMALHRPLFLLVESSRVSIEALAEIRFRPTKRIMG